MDYAMRHDVSLSTLRRYIKAGKISHKSEHGRYLIWDEDALPEGPRAVSGLTTFASSGPSPEIQQLQHHLRKAQEEIAELKTLLALYEEQLFGNNLAP